MDLDLPLYKDQLPQLLQMDKVFLDLVEHLRILSLTLERKHMVVEELVTKMMVIMEQQMEAAVELDFYGVVTEHSLMLM